MTARVGRPSPALIVAIIALAVAMTGTGYAALNLPSNSVGTKQLRNNAVTSSKLKNGAVSTAKLKRGAVTGEKVKRQSLTGADINVKTLGTVPSANEARHAATAGTARPVGAAGGGLIGSYPNPQIAAAEPIRFVGAPGQPQFDTQWTNVGGGFQPAGFYKDPFGTVHLQGDVMRTSSGTDAVIFVLPRDYCPSGGIANFPAYGNTGTMAAVAVRSSDCAVVFVAGSASSFIGLGGISFRGS
jgi:hypothetical protein